MESKPTVLGIIPARGGSKGIPGKNIRLLAGKPLIHYTIEAALKSSLTTTIVVSTDSEEILNIARQHKGIETPFLRPAELALDDTPSNAVVQHAVNYYEKSGKQFDFICLLQPTSPFRKDGLIDKTIRRIIECGGDSLITCRKVPTKYNPHWTFEMNANFLSVATGEKNIIARRQDLPACWHRDGKVYIATPQLIKQGKLLGNKLVCFENDDEPDVNIDTSEDWNLAEKIFQDGFC